MKQPNMDDDQLAILYVYSLYSSEKEHIYLQYTAALAVFYYLMNKGLFPNYKEQLLVYDYKDTRRFLWEDKKFMRDINIVRDHDFLNRARLKTQNYRDMNAHQCTLQGMEFLKKIQYKETDTARNIKKHLDCRCKRLFTVNLDNDKPYLGCNKCKNSRIPIENFLLDLSTPIDQKYSYTFI